MDNRRSVLARGFGGLILPGMLGLSTQASARADMNLRMPTFKGNVFKALEKQAGGRIGVFATQGRIHVGYREDERFAMCSTFKWVLAAAVLQAVDRGSLSLEQRVPFGEADLLDYAPVTRARVAQGGMTVAELCEAAVALSDNTAANLLLPLIGGPAGLTAFVRSLGDKVTRLDRNEPDLNSNIKNDPRDTTTPQAMTQLLLSVYRRDVLSIGALSWLKRWMIATSTGNDRIRAGVPAGWTVGDKTGTGLLGATNDVGVLWPPTDAAIYISVCCTGSSLDLAGRNRLIADITRAAIAALA
jgi:beta-lactamase class A